MLPRALAAILILAVHAHATWDDLGPYPAGQRFYSGTIPIQSNPAFPHLMHIWYPGEREGLEVPVATDGGPYPIIFFQHAGGSDYSWYDYQFARLASRGIIVMSIRHDHAGCPAEWWDCHRQLYARTVELVIEQWNETPGHFLYQRIDPDRITLGGHSHGAAFIAARDYRPMNPAGPYEIASVFLIAPCPEVPIGSYLETYENMPALQIIYGSKDEDGCTSGGQSTAIFETAARPRHFAYVIGANHWVFDERGSLGQSTITRLEAWRASGASMAAFQAFILNGDASALSALRGDEPLLFRGPEVRYQFLEAERLTIDDFDDEGPPTKRFGVAIAGLPGQTYVNGFLGDTFVSFESGVALVRNQIRDLLPPEGGPYDVLFYEDDALGPDVYIEAIAREQVAGLFGTLVSLSDAFAFEAMISDEWDLIFSAQQNGSSRSTLAYDDELADYVCGGGKAIIADFRINSTSALATLTCAGAPFDGTQNWSAMTSTSGLFEGTLSLQNPGWGIWTYGLTPGPGADTFAINDLFSSTGEHDASISSLELPVTQTGMTTFDERFMHVPAHGLFHLTWGVEFAWVVPGASFTHMLAPEDGPGLDARVWRDVSFRIVQVHGDPLNPVGATKDLRVVLADGDGDTATLALSDASQGPLRASVAPASVASWKSILETYRFPLAQFAAANPALDIDDLRSVTFLCDLSATGRCYLDDLELVVRDVPANIDDDGDVDFADLIAVLAGWGPCPAPPAECPADVDGDGGVGFADLVTVLSSLSER